MPSCPRCGREVSEETDFCPNCGGQIRPFKKAAKEVIKENRNSLIKKITLFLSCFILLFIFVPSLFFLMLPMIIVAILLFIFIIIVGRFNLLLY
jgi:uncharacterized membrane protein YvbJ